MVFKLDYNSAEPQSQLMRAINQCKTRPYRRWTVARFVIMKTVLLLEQRNALPLRSSSTPTQSPSFATTPPANLTVPGSISPLHFTSTLAPVLMLWKNTMPIEASYAKDISRHANFTTNTWIDSRQKGGFIRRWNWLVLKQCLLNDQSECTLGMSRFQGVTMETLEHSNISYIATGGHLGFQKRSEVCWRSINCLRSISWLFHCFQGILLIGRLAHFLETRRLIETEYSWTPVL